MIPGGCFTLFIAVCNLEIVQNTVMASSRLEELTIRISENTKLVKDYLSSNDAELSFYVGSELAFPADAPEEVLTARRVVREATKELYDLMTGPAEHLRWLSCSVGHESNRFSGDH
jgi:hypothetical protein